jgi:hypothetical protein
VLSIVHPHSYDNQYKSMKLIVNDIIEFMWGQRAIIDITGYSTLFYDKARNMATIHSIRHKIALAVKFFTNGRKFMVICLDAFRLTMTVTL